MTRAAKIIVKTLLQYAVTGQASRFTMRQRPVQFPSTWKKVGLYLHVPFCRSLCSFCPYNRIEYDEVLFNAYVQAVKQEIDLYAPLLPGLSFTSLYIGGGTPTVNVPGLLSILDHLRKRLGDVKPICIELHPGSMTGDCLQSLKDAGINMLSIGVEATADHHLQQLKRSHDGQTGIDAVRRAITYNFDAVNVDLMFALPGQTMKEWQTDIKSIVDIGVDQLSTYPLFGFPYSELGKMKGIRQVERPPHRIVKEMLDFTDDYCEHNKLLRCAVWSWLTPGKNKFSSISRHHYIGFGPSAASMTGFDFYVNTFDVKAYASKLPKTFPISLSMPVNRRLEMAYWLYWRIYELTINDLDFQTIFGEKSSLDREFGHLLAPLVPLRLLERTDNGYRITKPGAWYIHRLQNEFSLNYINNLWGTCRREQWPREVRL